MESERDLEGVMDGSGVVMKCSERSLEGAWKGCGRRLECVWKVFRMCLEDVWKVYGQN